MAEIAKLNWITRKVVTGGGAKRGTDIRISVSKHSDDRLVGSFTFYEGCYKLFSQTEYAQVAIYKNRVFFRESDEKNGMKMYTNKNTTSDIKYLRIYDADVTATLIAFEGCYELKYDDFYELYYIEKVGE